MSDTILTNQIQEAASRLRYMAAAREQARISGEESTRQREQTPWWRHPAQWWTARQAQKDAELRFDAAEHLVRQADADLRERQARREAGVYLPEQRVGDRLSELEAEHARVTEQGNAALEQVNEHLVAAGRGHAPWDRAAQVDREQEFLQARWADAHAQQLLGKHRELSQEIERERMEHERSEGRAQATRELEAESF